jgi:hypothetical protein
LFQDEHYKKNFIANLSIKDAQKVKRKEKTKNTVDSKILFFKPGLSTPRFPCLSPQLAAERGKTTNDYACNIHGNSNGNTNNLIVFIHHNKNGNTNNLIVKLWYL